MSFGTRFGGRIEWVECEEFGRTEGVAGNLVELARRGEDAVCAAACGHVRRGRTEWSDQFFDFFKLAR